MSQTESQGRWYLGLTEEQRDARRKAQRDRFRERYATDPDFREMRREQNARRLIVCGMYLGMIGFTKEERERMLAIRAHVSARLDEFTAGQRREREASGS